MDAIDSIPAKTPMCYVDSLFRFDIDGHVMSCHFPVVALRRLAARVG